MKKLTGLEIAKWGAAFFLAFIAIFVMAGLSGSQPDRGALVVLLIPAGVCVAGLLMHYSRKSDD